ncbi:uncharacterized protein LOC143275718 [Babylonia areolata]|uniref:uncharacterized protein LOC143275718 n=1 Tax=Babylonia areolata TaxID=304850 RepID=UPI003FD10D59
MFTSEEAVSFLQDRWGVERVQERFHDNSLKKHLLKEIILSVQSNVTFQSITLMAIPLEKRKRPSADVIKEECIAGRGGVCYSINVFAWGLLRAVGLSAQLCSATCTTTVGTPDNHILVIVNDLEKKGDVHVVECGVGFPTFRAVSLDFDEESPVYVDSFLEYKYILHEGKFLRMHGKGDTVKRNDPPVRGLDFIVGKCRRFYYFSLKPSDTLSDFDSAFDDIFTVPQLTMFHRSPRAMAFPRQRAVILVNNQLKMEKEGGEIDTVVLESDDAIVDSYRRYFPSLQEAAVRDALSQWHNLTQQ